MAVRVVTNSPQALLDAIRSAIRDRKVITWSCNADGYFTHAHTDWNGKAWLRASVSTGCLTFNIVPPRGATVSDAVYGVYHGRFIEMLLSHFRGMFSSADATAAPVKPDATTG